MLEDQPNYLILVLFEDVAMENLEADMRAYVKTNTYMKRDSYWFWEKLRYSMPLRPLLQMQSPLEQPRQGEDMRLEDIS